MPSTARVAVLVALVVSACGGDADIDLPATADPNSERRTSLGLVVGSRHDIDAERAAHAWRALPFAAAPLGPLRWRAPAAPPPWTGTREALAHPPACTQFATMAGGRDGAEAGTPTGQEDCLYLNVYAPAVRADEVPQGDARKPVMVWIHGGGNTIGDVSTYDGGRLAATQDVVVVTTQYRLGPLGWFRHEALREGADPTDASGNFGTLDLIRSLEWVRDHIAAFGGDPGNVTIFGESAGGHDVATLLLSPLAEGLFHRAILQSGGAALHDAAAAEVADDPDTPKSPRFGSEEAMLRWLVQQGRAADRAEAVRVRQEMSLADLAAFARGLSDRDVFGAYASGSGFGMIPMPRVFGDGTVLPAEPAEAVFARGDHHRVPIMLGATRDESKLFLLGDARLYGTWLGVLPRLLDVDRLEGVSRTLSDLKRHRGVDGLARALAAPDRPDLFAFRFDWDEEPKILLWDFSVLLGAAHGLDVFFVFGGWTFAGAERVLFNDANASARIALSDQMMSYWAAFAADGAPGQGRRGELPRWTPWTDAPATPRLMLLDTAADGGVRMAEDEVRLAGILEATLADERIGDRKGRCALLHDASAGPQLLGDTLLRPAHVAAHCGEPVRAEPWLGQSPGGQSS